MAKVLLVEDDNNLREIYEARLTAEGYDIVTAQNGEEALSVAKQQKPDLVISDVMMPRISGFEMLDILRNTDELKNTKVIMLTALGQAEDRGRADNLGADKYLVKSQVTLEDIVNAAKALLSDEPGDVTTPTVPAVPAATPEPVSAPVETPVVEQAAAPEPVATVDTSPVTSTPLVPSEPAAVAAPVTVTPSVAPVIEPLIASDATATPPVTTTPTSTTPAVDLVSATPIAATDPVAQPVNATVTVTDPDPIVPHISPAAEQLAPADAQPATAPNAEPVPEPAIVITPPVEPAASTTATTAAEPQTIAAEEAAIEAQIASFAANDGDTPAVTPAQASNDAVLEDAMSKLTTAESTLPSADQTPTEAIVVTAPTQEPVAEETPSPEPVAPPDPNIDTTSQISGRKVIQPISDIEAGTPNLEALLAKEEAKEATYNEQNSQPTVVDATAVNAPKSGIDPNTIAL